MDIRKHNEIAWNNEVKIGSKWTLPVSKKEIELAKKGDYKILIGPTRYAPKEWFKDVKGKNVLCLASGGGQQGPIFSALGAKVTVFDNSLEQLSKDDMVAKRDNLDIKLEKGDMRDLSRFKNETFDIIYNPVSNCFIDNLDKLWKECYRILKPKGGVLITSFVNPLMYIFEAEALNNNELIVKNTIPYSDIEQLSKSQLDELINRKEPLEFGHTLESQIGGQISAGFVIVSFLEDKVDEGVLDKYINTYIATRAIKI